MDLESLPFGLSLDVHGVRLAIRSDDDGVLQGLRDQEFPRHWREAGAGPVQHRIGFRQGWVLHEDQVYKAPEGRLPAARFLGSHLHLCVAEHATPEVFVHAAAVEVEGRVVLIPGRSWSGKSSLALALCRQGGALWSDDLAVLGPDGRISDFALPRSRRRPDHEPVLLPPERLGWVPGREPAPVGAVLLTSWTEGSRLRLRPITPAQAALGLLGHAVAARRHPGRVLETLARAVEGALAFEGPRGDADRAARWIRRKLAASGRS